MVMPRQQLFDLAFGANPMILSEDGLSEDQISVSSVDCTLGDRVYRMKSAALPFGEDVADLIREYTMFDFSLSEGETYVLERGACYIVELREKLNLGDNMYAIFSPKSSTGRCDVFVRVLCDGHSKYDRTPYGYRGRLYLEITSLSFNIKIASGLSLTQFRVRTPESKPLTNAEIQHLHAKYGLAFFSNGKALPHDRLATNDGLYYHIDLMRDIVGFKAISSPTEVLDMTQGNAHCVSDYWERIKRSNNNQIVLTPGAFYLLATKERTKMPPECCAEMMHYDVSSGEIRPHYAGFFDNGFGGMRGTTGVLEVRARDVPFRLKDGQPICRMVFEKTFEVPDRLYEGHYSQSGPSLSKHFKNRYKVWES